MKKRVFATVLWFYTGWYAGAMLAAAIGITPAIGPLIGLAGAVVVLADPGGYLWRDRRSAASPDTATSAGRAADAAAEAPIVEQQAA